VTTEYAGTFGLTVDPESVHCLRLMECVLRPDIKCRQIMSTVIEAFRSKGFLVQELQQSHAVTEPPQHYKLEWHLADLQICVSRKLRQRVLVCRFLRKHSLLKEMTTDQVSTTTLCFIDHLRHCLIQSSVAFSCLYIQPRSSIEGLDQHFRTQLESAARDRMHASLKDSKTPMEDHAKITEWRCTRLITTLQPIYNQHGIVIPDIEPVGDLHDYPLDTQTLIQNDLGEVEGASDTDAGDFDEAVAHVLALRDREWARTQHRCDAELTARMRRFNAHIMDRIANAQAHQRSLIAQLLGHPHISTSPLTTEFRRAFSSTPIAVNWDDEIFVVNEEVPVYTCYCLVSAKPCYLFVTGGFLCFSSTITGPFIAKWCQVISLLAIESVKKYYGGYMSVPNTVAVCSFTSSSQIPDPAACSTTYFTPAATDCGRVIDVIEQCMRMRREDKASSRRSRSSSSSISNLIPTLQPNAPADGHAKFLWSEPDLPLDSRDTVVL
jgi:hypothetical protein